MICARNLSLLSLLGLVIGTALFAQRRPAEEEAKVKPAETCALRIELVDEKSGHALSGVISVRNEAGKRVSLSELLPRGLGVEAEFAIHEWHVLPEPATVKVPREKLKLKAFHGLETEFGEAEIDLSGKAEARVKIPLKRFADTHARGWQSANTHVHLQKTSRAETDRYLLEVARAEGLEIVYISYLERAEADLEYTTNKYTREDLRKLTEQSRGGHGPGGHGHAHPHSHSTEFDNGQEHRHNFTGFDEGYGHVMLLHLPELVQPVSIGPGITKKGTDSPPLVRGIDKARGMGSTIIWCHNQWGLEDIPNWLGGKLHANNIFDGGTHGSYKHSFYRYLNAGLRVPFSTGTDWFIYDFSRVYVLTGKEKVGGEKYLSSEEWLAHLAEGRSFITNGPLLEFTANGRGVGETVELKEPGTVTISGRALGRLDFQRIELVKNGEVIKSAVSRPRGGHFEAEMEFEAPIDGPCWLALRTPPPSTPRDAEFERKTPLNEYGRELFSHTSAIYVWLKGRGVFQKAAAESLLAEMQASREFIAKRGLFANDAERDGVLKVYDAGIKQMSERLAAER